MAVLALVAVSCYDDSALRAELEDHESRIVKLESLCNELNTNIKSLKTIVDAINAGDYITSVTPVIEGGKEVGYTIAFAKTGTITIYHGQDGSDGKDGQDGAPGKDGQDGVDVGSTPEIGVRLDEDGVYYWTLNGEWLLDDNGNKIKAVGTDGKDGDNGADGTPGVDGSTGPQGPQGPQGEAGKDGVTPQLKIEDDYWYVSYDNGENWIQLGKATGEDGEAGGDSIFSDVYQSGGYVYFVLSNGDSFKVPTAAASALDIQFDVEQGVAIVPETTLKIKYTITGAEGDVYVRATSFNYDGELLGVKPIDASTGYLYVYQEGWFDGEDDENRDELIWDEMTEEDYYNNTMAVLVVAADSKGSQVSKVLTFVEGVLESVNDAYLTDAVAGTVTATMRTNVLENSYEVVIPDKAKSWLSYSPTKAQMREDVLNFSVTANEADKFRSATIKLVNNMGQTFETFTIVQRSLIAGEVMTFADSRVKAVCVARYDKNLDGELTYEEAATVTDVEDLFLLEKNIVSFDEFEYFSSVSEIPDGLFANCGKLESVKLPESVIAIGTYAFENCVSLKSIVVPEGVTGNYDYEEWGTGYWFSGCSALESVTLPSTLKALPYSGFANCTSLKSITIPEGIAEIPNECFSGCTELSELNYITPINFVGSRAFEYCRSLKEFDFSAIGRTDYYDEGYYSIGDGAFMGTGLTSVALPETVSCIPDDVFAGCSDLASVTLHDGIRVIESNAFGSYEYYDESGNRIYVSCSSLKNIELPANLETIGQRAFIGSALEGQATDGFAVKALVIPAKVTSINYEAFNGCSNLSAVKMLSMFPPQINYSFDAGTVVYVHADALDSYKNSDWSDYTILPYDMMSVSFELEFESSAAASFDGEYFNFPVSAKISSSASDIDNVAEFGYFVKRNDYYYEDEVVYYPVETLDVAVTDILSVSPYDGFTENMESYVAKAEYQVGAYIRLVDGTVVTYDKQSVELVYDSKPSIALSDIVDNGNGVYCHPITVSGAFWLADFRVDCDGAYVGEYYDEWRKDGTMDVTLTLDDYTLCSDVQLMFYAYDRNGNTIIETSVSYEDLRSDLYLIGTFNGWTNGDEAYKMTREEGWYVFYGFTAVEEVEVKMNKGDWGTTEIGSYDTFVTDTAMAAGDNNICVPAGTYDIFVKDDGSLVYFMTPGTRPE